MNELELVNKPKATSLNWYLFSQNNSGGKFVVNDKLCHNVIIQARDVEESCQIAESLGVYFNGVEFGVDCNCCGDRWYSPFGNIKLPIETNSKTINSIHEYAQYLANLDFFARPNFPSVRIYHLDMTVTEIFKEGNYISDENT